MTTVFVSHSKRDEKIKNFFALIFNRKGINSILMELEDLQYMNKGVEISRKICEESDALVVLLGKNVQSPPKRAHNFTRNWVSFEVGVAAGCKKPV